MSIPFQRKNQLYLYQGSEWESNLRAKKKGGGETEGTELNFHFTLFIWVLHEKKTLMYVISYV